MYYSPDNQNIYQIKLFFKDLVAIVPKNMYFPITKETKVWYKKPKSIETETTLLQFVERKENAKTYSYIFKEMNNA
jgi:hypothetical protein